VLVKYLNMMISNGIFLITCKKGIVWEKDEKHPVE
jgi:hypothetical protein